MSRRLVPPVQSALPNDLPPDRLHLRPSPDGAVSIDPERAGWRYLSFRSARLAPRAELSIGGSQETCVVVLAGSASVEINDGTTLALPGRPSVWDGLPWAAYLPPGCSGMLRAGDPGLEMAIASAPVIDDVAASDRALVIGPEQVSVEIRGGGNATRQITHILTPAFPAHRLEIVEVYTPSGNWSSWPPHKHDVDDMPNEAVLEEVYHYRFRRPEAWGVQRLYRRDGTRDALWAVRDGELVLVTDGYHPFVATQGDDAYYLNALAGDRRTMACSFDPDLDWVRNTWTEMAPDPRVPLVPAAS